VLTADSADEALALLEANAVAVILTDQRMPNGTGAELLARSLDIAPETTRVLFTGYSDISAVIDAVNEGQVYRYLAKPWRPEELKAVLGQGLERYRLVLENRRLLRELQEANEDLERKVRERTLRLQEQNEALREARERIEELSRRDALTGLTNRRWLDELLRLEVERAKRYGAPLSVIMVDLDHFKVVNDSFGHAVGDQVLKSAARTLREAVRMTDVVGRYGGEEFLVLLPNTGMAQATVLAERMRAGLRLMPVGFRPDPVTGSFGVTQCTRPSARAGTGSCADPLCRALQQILRTSDATRETTMAEATMDEFLRDNHDAILVAVQEKMRGDETMGRIAVQRDLSESDLASQILGFWLQGIRSDLTLGSTATMAQSMQWLVSLRAGHDLPFDDAMVLSMFDDISDEIDGRLDSDALRDEYAAYREQVTTLITDAFPQ
jgi:diguanylate cyclase (GGDEF)-like protein